LSFAFWLGGEGAIGDYFGHLCAETAERVGKVRAGQIAAGEKDMFASELSGKFLGESQAVVFCRDAAYRQANAASRFGGDRADGRDAQGGKGIHNVDAERLRAFHQGTYGVCTGEQEPIEGAQSAKRLI
jgi:hypothetical protein